MFNLNLKAIIANSTQPTTKRDTTNVKGREKKVEPNCDLVLHTPLKRDGVTKGNSVVRKMMKFHEKTSNTAFVFNRANGETPTYDPTNPNTSLIWLHAVPQQVEVENGTVLNNLRIMNDKPASLGRNWSPKVFVDTVKEVYPNTVHFDAQENEVEGLGTIYVLVPAANVVETVTEDVTTVSTSTMVVADETDDDEEEGMFDDEDGSEEDDEFEL